MIKKEYMTPETDVLDMKLQAFICASDPNVTDPDEWEYD